MGALKLTYYDRQRDLEVNLLFLVKGLEKNALREKNRVSSSTYGFNGKEKDNEVQGDGNIYDYGFRIYGPRLGIFLSIDPLFRTFPWWTPYQFAGGSPIRFIDLDGKEKDDPQKPEEEEVEEEIDFNDFPVPVGTPPAQTPEEIEEEFKKEMKDAAEKIKKEVDDKAEKIRKETAAKEKALADEFSKEFIQKIGDPLEKGEFTDFIGTNLPLTEAQRQIAEQQFFIDVRGNTGRTAIVNRVTIAIIDENFIDKKTGEARELLHKTFENPSPAIPSSNKETTTNPGINRVIIAPFRGIFKNKIDV